MDDIIIEKTINNLDIDKRKKYIVVGMSDGIYYAFEFARQYPKLVKELISLDGSWITRKLCKQRLTNWRNKGKNVKLIKTQKELNILMDEIINGEELFSKIMDHTRYDHTIKCIRNSYQDIIKKIKFTLFRDFNGDVKNEIDKQFNDYALLEHEILSKVSNKYQIFWQINAGHALWFNETYKNQIVDYIRSHI